MNARICLTQEIFRRLDVLTRTEAAMPLHVFDYRIMEDRPEGTRGAFGRAEQKRIPVLVESTPESQIFEEMFVIDVANYIPLAKWYRSSPFWLDKEVIPNNLVYDFLVWHEIAHVKFGDMVAWPHFEKKGMPLEWRGKLHLCTEIRADRYAWKKLFPGKPMPPRRGIDKQGREVIQKLDGTLSKFLDDFNLLRRKYIIPLDTDPQRYIPFLNLEGIPWASN